MDKAKSPFNMTWLTVNRGCNFRCAWCYAAGTGYDPDDDMPFELAMEHIEIAKQVGTTKMFLIGGEPTLWPHLFAITDALRDAGIRSILVSNAFKFANDEFWEAYQQHPCDAVGASFKGYDAESLFQSTGVRNFDAATKGLRRICELQRNSVLSFVYASAYEGHLVDMVRYAKECGAYGVSVNFCAPGISTEGVDASCLVPTDTLIEEVVSTYDRIHDLTEGRIIYVIKHPLCMFPRGFIEKLRLRQQIATTCHLQHRTGGIIGHNGELTLCNHMAAFPVGKYGADYTDGDSLLHLYASPTVQRVFDKMKMYPSIRCRNCSVYEDCAGGCPILWTHHKPAELIPGWDA